MRCPARPIPIAVVYLDARLAACDRDKNVAALGLARERAFLDAAVMWEDAGDPLPAHQQVPGPLACSTTTSR